jgi:hypothetical protein
VKKHWNSLVPVWKGIVNLDRLAAKATTMPARKAIGKVLRTRKMADRTTTEIAYYPLSRVLSPERLNQVV